MEDPLSPQPNPTPTPARPSPGLSALPRSYLHAVDRQHASQFGQDSSRNADERQAVVQQLSIEQVWNQASPSGWKGPVAPSIGGVKLTRTPIGKTAGTLFLV